jgi:hypothetical protein
MDFSNISIYEAFEKIGDVPFDLNIAYERSKWSVSPVDTINILPTHDVSDWEVYTVCYSNPPIGQAILIINAFKHISNNAIWVSHEETGNLIGWF